LLALDFIRKSEYTVKIHEQDRSRDRIFRGFVEIAQAAMHHFDPVTVAAGTLLYDIFKHYGNIAKKTLDDETAAINDLLRELQHPACENALITLNATAWRGRLQRENEDFAALMTDRYVEVSGQTPYRMVTTRTDTDRYYHGIVNQLENQEMAGNHVADALIKELNAVLERFKHILAQEIGERIPPPPPNNETNN
jgi:hypothetical protein